MARSSTHRPLKWTLPSWESNQLEGILPDKLTRNEVDKRLEELIDQSSCTCTQSRGTHNSALQQLVNHLHAYRILCNEDVVLSCLTEDLIKSVHKTMMQDYVFPPHKCVPSSMVKIVADYESQASTTHIS